MTDSQSSPRRVLIAGIFHETHTFLDGVTGLDEFHALRGEEFFSAIGDASPLAGVMETARDLGWDVVPGIDCRATPSAIVEDAVVEDWWEELEPIAINAAAEGLAAIYLVLHGAMTSQSIPDVEGDVLSRLRSIPGLETVPIGGVTDLHANFTPLMAQHSNALVTYRRNPHSDAKEVAAHAARLLDRIVTTGLAPRTLFAHPRIMWPPTGTATADEPMRSLEARARQIEAEGEGVLAVNVHAGFSFADTPETGASFSIVTTGDREIALSYLDELCQMAIDARGKGNVVDPPIHEVMPLVRELLSQPGKGPIILVEPSDNIGGGAPGDGVGVLRVLVEQGIENSAVVINDPKAVASIADLAPGATRTLSIGGKGSRLSGGPIELEVELVSTSDGRFTLEDPQSHLASLTGLHIDMGPSAVVRHAGISILLTTNKTPPMDLGQLRSQGIVPEEKAVIAVKAAVAHRQAYDPITRASFNVGTPGPCASELRGLPFHLVKRSIYPLDETVEAWTKHRVAPKPEHPNWSNA